MSQQYGVILFHTTSSVMRAEKLLKSANLDIKLIPTPREFSSDCGIAIRFDGQEVDRVRAALEISGVEIAGIHFVVKSKIASKTD